MPAGEGDKAPRQGRAKHPEAAYPGERVEAAYFQCSRAVVRSALWSSERHVTPGSLPTPGKILADASAGKLNGELYDRELPACIKSTLY